MWNFTVGGLLVPQLEEIQHLFESKETAEESQRAEEVTADNTFIGDYLSWFSLENGTT